MRARLDDRANDSRSRSGAGPWPYAVWTHSPMMRVQIFAARTILVLLVSFGQSCLKLKNHGIGSLRFEYIFVLWTSFHFFAALTNVSDTEPIEITVNGNIWKSPSASVFQPHFTEP